MKLEQDKETLYYSLSLIGHNELELLKCSMNAIHKLLASTNLDYLVDNQEKNDRIKRLESIIADLSSLNGSQTAESWDGTIIKKVLEKYIKC